MAELQLFVDTNFFLHFRDPAESPWCDLTGESDIVLRVGRTVQREINDHAFVLRGRRQDRAKAWAKKFAEAAGGTALVLRQAKPRVTLELFRRPVGWAPPTEIDPSVPDDQIVADLLSFADAAPEMRCGLLTNDSGMIGTAALVGAEVFRPAEVWLLPPEASAESKEIRSLKAEIERLTRRKSFAELSEALARLVEAEQARLAARGVMAGGDSILTIAILPQEHFEGHPRLIENEGYTYFQGPVYGGGYQPFTGAPDGSEILTTNLNSKTYQRLYVSEDWFVLASVVHAITVTPGEGRLALYELQKDLEDYLEALGAIFERNNVRGPFAIEIAFTQLKASQRVGPFFRHDGPARWRAREPAATFDAKAFAQEAYDQLKRALVFG